jgi:predicted enzyme related to lactoylglutathione lyase
MTYATAHYGGIIVANPFVHVELTTPDVEKAKSFYSALFDWKLEDVEQAPGKTYTMIRVGNGTGGGMMKIPTPAAPAAASPAIPTAWMPYVRVDDVRAATAKAKSLGATVAKDVTEVTGAGAFSVIIDPTGAAIGL